MRLAAPAGNDGHHRNLSRAVGMKVDLMVRGHDRILEPDHPEELNEEIRAQSPPAVPLRVSPARQQPRHRALERGIVHLGDDQPVADASARRECSQRIAKVQQNASEHPRVESSEALG